MKSIAVAAIVLGILGQLGSIYYFALRPDDVQFLPLVVAVSLFSALEAAGVLALARRGS